MRSTAGLTGTAVKVAKTTVQSVSLSLPPLLAPSSPASIPPRSALRPGQLRPRRLPLPPSVVPRRSPSPLPSPPVPEPSPSASHARPRPNRLADGPPLSLPSTGCATAATNPPIVAPSLDRSLPIELQPICSPCRAPIPPLDSQHSFYPPSSPVIRRAAVRHTSLLRTPPARRARTPPPASRRRSHVDHCAQPMLRVSAKGDINQDLTRVGGHESS